MALAGWFGSAEEGVQRDWLAGRRGLETGQRSAHSPFTDFRSPAAIVFPPGRVLRKPHARCLEHGYLLAMPAIILKPGHVQPVWSGHPWVYAQAIDRVEGGATSGDEVSVRDPKGNLLGRGFYSPGSSIPVRIASRTASPPLGPEWIRDRLLDAKKLRETLGLPSDQTTGFRLVHSEGDCLPGLVVDLFGDTAAVQLTTVGMQRRRDVVFEAVMDVSKVRTIVDCTPGTYAQFEGFEPTQGVVRGDPSTDSVRFDERGLQYELPLALGQKTGFYVDQRPLRARVEQLAAGLSVLDLYCYVGSFAMSAVRGGARSVVAVDENALALEVAARCAALNRLNSRIALERQPAREALASAGQKGGYDLVIVDPPNLAPSQRVAPRALAAYQKLAARSCRATRPGGLLVLCCCSSAIGLGALTRALALGARDVGMRATVLERHFQGADHPVPSAFPEGLYLKSLVARVDVR